MKFQAPNPKSQISSKSQFPMTLSPFFGILGIGYWNLFGAWSLEIGA
jgi:hypothetical protein